jgi:hypothetical protein
MPSYVYRIKNVSSYHHQHGVSFYQSAHFLCFPSTYVSKKLDKHSQIVTVYIDFSGAFAQLVILGIHLNVPSKLALKSRL